jgi:soluble lytic murein transglycosylase-like protein
VSLASARIQVNPFGRAVYDSRGPIRRQMPAYLTAIMTEAGQKHGVDPRLLAAVAARESAFNPNAVSRVGACGVMQLMPATAQYLGVSNVFDARENVMGGARYLRRLLDTFHGDLDLTLAAYNAGPGAVQKFKGVPPYAETRAYVSSIRASYEQSIK